MKSEVFQGKGRGRGNDTHIPTFTWSNLEDQFRLEGKIDEINDGIKEIRERSHRLGRNLLALAGFATATGGVILKGFVGAMVENNDSLFSDFMNTPYPNLILSGVSAFFVGKAYDKHSAMKAVRNNDKVFVGTSSPFPERPDLPTRRLGDVSSAEPVTSEQSDGTGLPSNEGL